MIIKKNIWLLIIINLIHIHGMNFLKYTNSNFKKFIILNKNNFNHSQLKNSNKNLFLFWGMPGSGKGLLAKHCEEKFKWAHLSTENLCRTHIEKKTEIGKEIISSIEKGLLIPDSFMFKIISDEFEKINNNNIIVDGFPRTDNQIKICHEWLKKINNLKSYILFLDASETIVRDRLINRIICSNTSCDKSYSKKDIPLICSKCHSKLIARQDDSNILSIENRIKIFHDHKEKMLKYWKNDSLYRLIHLEADSLFEKKEDQCSNFNTLSPHAHSILKNMTK